MDSERDVSKLKDVLSIFDNIDLLNYLNSDEGKPKICTIQKFLSNHGKKSNSSISDMLTALAKLLLKIDKQAKNDSLTNTVVADINRKPSVKTDIARVSFKEKIVKCCIGCDIAQDPSLTSKSLNKDGLKPANLKFDKKAFIFLGGPACGKSTFAEVIANKYGAYLLDSDIIKRKIPEFYDRETGASLVHEESKEIYSKILNELKNTNINIVTPIIGKNYESLVENIEAFREFEYNVTLVLTWVNKVDATRRALFRFLENGRYVPLTYILDICGHESLANFYRLCCNDQELSALAIDNQQRPGKIQFNRNCDEIVDILKANNKII